jgi:hypothetical protein
LEVRAMTRQESILRITRRLIILTGIGLALIGLLFGATLFLGQKFMVSWSCLLAGVLGGFVSIQQRLYKIGDEELSLLSASWFQISLIPIYGGLFALVLYVILLSGIISGKFFPQFSTPSLTGPVTKDYFISFFRDTYPASGEDLAKLILWCFIAGFSERFVPQIINDVALGVNPNAASTTTPVPPQNPQ